MVPSIYQVRVMVLRVGMRGWSVLRSVPLMSSGVFIIFPVTRWLDLRLVHY